MSLVQGRLLRHSRRSVLRVQDVQYPGQAYGKLVWILYCSSWGFLRISGGCVPCSPDMRDANVQTSGLLYRIMPTEPGRSPLTSKGNNSTLGRQIRLRPTCKFRQVLQSTSIRHKLTRHRVNDFAICRRRSISSTNSALTVPRRRQDSVFRDSVSRMRCRRVYLMG